MSRFTKHFAISPSPNNWGRWINDRELDYWIDSKVWGRRIIVPQGYEFDGASVPYIFWSLIQKVEADTIVPSCIHDYVYTDMREIGRVKSDIIFLESLIIYNIPRLLSDKKYFLAFCMVIKYTLMTTVLLLFSWFVWYGLDKKIWRFIWL